MRLGLGMPIGGRWAPGGSAGYTRPGGALTFASLDTPLRPGRLTQFNGIGASAWTFYARAYYDGGANRTILGVRRSNGFLIRINSGQVIVTNWTTTYSGASITLAAGIYDLFAAYDGTTLNVWIKPEGGTLSAEMSTAVTFGFASDTEVRFGANASSTAASAQWNGAVYCGALWTTALTETDRDALFAGSDPRNHAIDSLHWYPSPQTAEDLAGKQVTCKRFGAPVSTSGLTTAPVILTDPDSGAPVQHGGVYWAGCSGSANSVDLYSSADLLAWSFVRTITVATTDFETSVEDLIYLGNVAGAHAPFQLYSSGAPIAQGVRTVRMHTSSDMTTWTADAANPIFTNNFSDEGVEDFRIVRVSDGVWGAVYEHNGLEDGTPAIGLARCLGTVPSGAWENMDDAPFDGDFGYSGPITFIANPTVVKHGGVFHVLYEGSNSGESGTEAGLPEVTLVRTAPDFFAGPWTKRGVMTWNSFPNKAFVRDGVVTTINTDRALYVYDPTQLFGA